LKFRGEMEMGYFIKAYLYDASENRVDLDLSKRFSNAETFFISREKRFQSLDESRKSLIPKGPRGTFLN